MRAVLTATGDQRYRSLGRGGTLVGSGKVSNLRRVVRPLFEPRFRGAGFTRQSV